MRRHPSRLMTVGAAGIACAVLLSTGASAAPSPARMGAATADTASGTAMSQRAITDDPPTPGVPAPADFQQQLSDIYGNLLGVIATDPGDSGIQLPANSAFQTMVDNLDQDQLNAMYDANPQLWDQLQNYLGTIPPSTLKTEKATTDKAKAEGKVKSQAKAAQPNAAQPNAVTPFPQPPELQSCLDSGAANALVATGEGLELGSLALDAASSGVSRDFIAVVLGEGTDIVDPIFTVLEIAARALDAAKTVIDIILEQNDICEAANDDANHEYMVEALQALGARSDDLLAGQTTIENNESDISASISSSLSQTLQKIANLQTSQNTSQDSLDLALKERIEAALLGGTTTVLTDYELPNSAGGYLDATPIGVKKIVTDALAAMQANGQSVASTASRFLVLANNYLAAGQYKKAFAEYQLTYQAIAK